LRNSEWERIRDHFPEENIPDGHPGREPIPTRQVLEAALWISQYSRAMAHAAAMGANCLAFKDDTLRELAAQILTWSKSQGATAPVMVGHRMTGSMLACTGSPAQAR
jgi:hypothetical protein